MEDNIEYLEEYEDLIIPSIKSDDEESASTARKKKMSTVIAAEDDSSSSIDQDIFESLFDDQSDDESDILKKNVVGENRRRAERESIDSLDQLVRDLGERVPGTPKTSKQNNEVRSTTATMQAPPQSRPIPLCFKKASSIRDVQPIKSNDNSPRSLLKNKAEKRVMFAHTPVVKREASSTSAISTPSSSSSLNRSSHLNITGRKPISFVRSNAGSLSSKATTIASNSQRKFNRPQPTIIRPEKVQFRDPVDDPLSLENVSNDLDYLSDTSEDSFASISEILEPPSDCLDIEPDISKKHAKDVASTRDSSSKLFTGTEKIEIKAPNPPRSTATLISTESLPEKATIISDMILSRIDSSILESLASNASKEAFSKEKKKEAANLPDSTNKSVLNTTPTTTTLDFKPSNATQHTTNFNEYQAINIALQQKEAHYASKAPRLNDTTLETTQSHDNSALNTVTSDITIKGNNENNLKLSNLLDTTMQSDHVSTKGAFEKLNITQVNKNTAKPVENETKTLKSSDELVVETAKIIKDDPENVQEVNDKVNSNTKIQQIKAQFDEKIQMEKIGTATKLINNNDETKTQDSKLESNEKSPKQNMSNSKEQNNVVKTTKTEQSETQKSHKMAHITDSKNFKKSAENIKKHQAPLETNKTDKDKLKDKDLKDKNNKKIVEKERKEKSEKPQSSHKLTEKCLKKDEKQQKQHESQQESRHTARKTEVTLFSNPDRIRKDNSKGAESAKNIENKQDTIKKQQSETKQEVNEGGTAKKQEPSNEPSTSEGQIKLKQTTNRARTTSVRSDRSDKTKSPSRSEDVKKSLRKSASFEMKAASTATTIFTPTKRSVSSSVGKAKVKEQTPTLKRRRDDSICSKDEDDHKAKHARTLDSTPKRQSEEYSKSGRPGNNKLTTSSSKKDAEKIQNSPVLKLDKDDKAQTKTKKVRNKTTELKDTKIESATVQHSSKLDEDEKKQEIGKQKDLNKTNEDLRGLEPMPPVPVELKRAEKSPLNIEKFVPNVKAAKTKGTSVVIDSSQKSQTATENVKASTSSLNTATSKNTAAKGALTLATDATTNATKATAINSKPLESTSGGQQARSKSKKREITKSAENVKEKSSTEAVSSLPNEANDINSIRKLQESVKADETINQAEELRKESQELVQHKILDSTNLESSPTKTMVPNLQANSASILSNLLLACEPKPQRERRRRKPDVILTESPSPSNKTDLAAETKLIDDKHVKDVNKDIESTTKIENPGSSSETIKTMPKKVENSANFTETVTPAPKKIESAASLTEAVKSAPKKAESPSNKTETVKSAPKTVENAACLTETVMSASKKLESAASLTETVKSAPKKAESSSNTTETVTSAPKKLESDASLTEAVKSAPKKAESPSNKTETVKSAPKTVENAACLTETVMSASKKLESAASLTEAVKSAPKRLESAASLNETVKSAPKKAESPNTTETVKSAPKKLESAASSTETVKSAPKKVESPSNATETVKSASKKIVDPASFSAAVQSSLKSNIAIKSVAPNLSKTAGSKSLIDEPKANVLSTAKSPTRASKRKVEPKVERPEPVALFTAKEALEKINAHRVSSPNLIVDQQQITSAMKRPLRKRAAETAFNSTTTDSPFREPIIKKDNSASGENSESTVKLPTAQVPTTKLVPTRKSRRRNEKPNVANADEADKAKQLDKPKTTTARLPIEKSTPLEQTETGKAQATTKKPEQPVQSVTQKEKSKVIDAEHSIASPSTSSVGNKANKTTIDMAQRPPPPPLAIESSISIQSMHDECSSPARKRAKPSPTKSPKVLTLNEWLAQRQIDGSVLDAPISVDSSLETSSDTHSVRSSNSERKRSRYRTEIDILKESMSKEMRESDIDILIQSHSSATRCLTKRSIAAMHAAATPTPTTLSYPEHLRSTPTPISVTKTKRRPASTTPVLVGFARMPGSSHMLPITNSSTSILAHMETKISKKSGRKKLAVKPAQFKCRKLRVLISRSTVPKYFEKVKKRGALKAALGGSTKQLQQSALQFEMATTHVKRKAGKRQATTFAVSSNKKSAAATTKPEIQKQQATGSKARASLMSQLPTSTPMLPPIITAATANAMNDDACLLTPISVAPTSSVRSDSSRRAKSKRQSATTVNTSAISTLPKSAIKSTTTSVITTVQQATVTTSSSTTAVTTVIGSVAPKTEYDDDDADYTLPENITPQTAIVTSASTSSAAISAQLATLAAETLPPTSMPTTFPLIIGASSHSLPPIVIDSAGTRLYSFLHPTKYNSSHGCVMLDYCCPNLDGPMTAIDPTRRHARVEAAVRELPAYITMETRLVTRAELEADANALPASIRNKVQRITGSKAAASKATSDTLCNSRRSATQVSMAKMSFSTPTPLASTSLSSTITALQKQLPSTTTLTPKITPSPTPNAVIYKTTPTNVSANISATAAAAVAAGMPTATIAPTTIAEMRSKARTNLKKVDILLKKHCTRISLLTYAERQRVVETMANATQLLPRDIENMYRGLQEYVMYMAVATATAAVTPEPTSAPARVELRTSNTASTTATSVMSAAGTTLQAMSTRAHSKRAATVNAAIAAAPTRTVPIYNADKTVIGYQVQIVSSSTTRTSNRNTVTSSGVSNTTVATTSSSSSMSTRRSGIFVIDNVNGSAPTAAASAALTTTTSSTPSSMYKPHTPRYFYAKNDMYTSTPNSTIMATKTTSSLLTPSPSSVVTRSGSTLSRLGREVTIRQVGARNSPPVTMATTSSATLPRLPTLTRNPHLPPLASSSPIVASTSTTSVTQNLQTNVISTPSLQKRSTRKGASAGAELIVVNHDIQGNPLPNVEESILPDEGNNGTVIKSESLDEF